MSISNLQAIRESTGVAIPAQIEAWVGGEPVATAGDTLLEIYYPATAELVSHVVEDGTDVVDQAIADARAAFTTGPWPRLPVAERQELLRRAMRKILTHQDELATLETLCAGLPVNHLRNRQIPRAAANFGFFADVISMLAGETFEQEDGYLTMVTREPAGVAALLSPWNAPLALSTMQIASCIAFGNTCVVKPSEHTPLAVHRMVELLHEAGIPPGVVNLVNGRGTVTGQALVSHPGVDRIAFTGSTATARCIMACAAERVTPVHFELGGKSANIVFEDADFERALDGSLVNAYSNSGQICVAGSRILIQRSIAERFIEAFARRVGRLRVGDPMSSEIEVGPLAFEAHMDKVIAYMDLAREEGADLLAGGSRIEALKPGYFVEPTAVRVTSNRLRICQEEVFGPFATLQVFDEPDEAIAIANESDYGLVGYAWTGSMALALEVQQRVRAGSIWINTPLARDLRAPFGGYKQSGIGRDGPRQCATFFAEEKSTIVPRVLQPLRRMGADGDGGILR